LIFYGYLGNSLIAMPRSRKYIGFFYLIHFLQLLNINCIFSFCDFKRNNIEEKDFLKHLSEKHSDEIIKISKKDNMSIKVE